MRAQRGERPRPFRLTNTRPIRKIRWLLIMFLNKGRHKSAILHTPLARADLRTKGFCCVCAHSGCTL